MLLNLATILYLAWHAVTLLPSGVLQSSSNWFWKIDGVSFKKDFLKWVADSGIFFYCNCC
jgi:hypothetical protein